MNSDETGSAGPMPPSIRQLGRGMWGIFRWVRGLAPARPRTVEDRVQRIEEEQAIRDVLSRYAYSYDMADLAGIISVFADDATNVTSRGVYEGKEAIRRNYEFLVSRRRIAFQYTTNITVRVSNNFRHVLAAEPYPSATVPPPAPTESTADWIEPQYTLL
ncbi:MAG: nuclear transport factor 2 family protein [Chloroflexota bacterium]|nr:nuclear transport factor 2 family protein [Chloroflexota bacterium]